MEELKHIEKRLIDKETTILEALKKMDDIGKKLLIIMDNDKFINLLSIGDIQRAIIKNVSLNNQVNTITRSNVTVGSPSDSLAKLKKMIIEHRMELMPIIDENKRITGVLLWEDFFKKEDLNKKPLNIPVIIMAGGLGTRLRPITHILPKPLIPIGDKTILEHIMNKFQEEGCNEFILSVNYKANMIKYYFDNNPDSYSIEYIYETTPLGTAGSLGLITKRFTSPIFISNCDIFVKEDYSEILNYHQKNNNVITIVAAILNHKIPYGCLETKEDGILESITEKPEFTYKINAGFYILEPSAFNEIPNNEFFHITDLIEKIKNQGGKVGVFPISEKSWIDIGQWDQYLKIDHQNFLKNIG